jgi:hypothetical protein
MKNELPILLSWMRDIKKCQITQTNWNVSSRFWELQNDDLIEEVMISTKDLFYERYNYRIFEKTITPIQFLKDGEIDLVGIQMKSGTIANIYGVITADGLNIGSTSVTIEKIIIDMLRTAMLFYGYFNLSKATIIFASPDLNFSINEQVTESVYLLNEVLKVFGFHFSFIIYINDKYNIHIHNLVDNQIKTKKKTKPLQFEESIGENHNSSSLLEYLQQLGYEVIDKREKGGALWLIGGKELEPFIKQLSEKEKIKFNFTIKGSKSTNNKPAWYTQSK